MDTDTGEMKEFARLEDIPKDEKWVVWDLYEIVKCKDCTFKVEKINIAENTITLKGSAGTKIK